MAETTSAPNNKAVTFGVKPIHEPSGAAKKSKMRKTAKRAIRRGAISEKAAKRHLDNY